MLSSLCLMLVTLMLVGKMILVIVTQRLLVKCAARLMMPLVRLVTIWAIVEMTFGWLLLRMDTIQAVCVVLVGFLLGMGRIDMIKFLLVRRVRCLWMVLGLGLAIRRAYVKRFCSKATDELLRPFLRLVRVLAILVTTLGWLRLSMATVSELGTFAIAAYLFMFF